MIEENEFVNVDNQEIKNQIDVRKATRQANMLKARQAKLAKQKQAKLNPIPKPTVQTYQYEDYESDDDEDEEEFVIQPMKNVNNYFTQPPSQPRRVDIPIKQKKLSHYNPVPQHNNEVLERLNYLENMFSNIAVKNTRKAKPKTKAKKSIQIIQTPVPVQAPVPTPSLKTVIKNNPDLLNNLKGVFGY